MNPADFYGHDEYRRLQRRYYTIKRAQWKAEGRCIDCGGKRNKRPDRVRCKRCLRINAKAAMKRKKLIQSFAWQAGNCIECKAHPRIVGRPVCRYCYKVRKTNNLKREQRVTFKQKGKRRRDLGSTRPPQLWRKKQKLD